MKSIVATFTAALLGLSLVQAGPIIDKNIIPPPDVCDCYPPGLQLGGFVSGLFPDGNADEAIGGGISLAYFFTDRLGIETSYAAYDTEPQVHHLSTVDLIYRLFINDNNCFSPYLLGGGGVLSNGDNLGLYRAGAGLEMRFEGANCWGIFLDGTYNWINDTDDAAVARLGFRIPW